MLGMHKSNNYFLKKQLPLQKKWERQLPMIKPILAASQRGEACHESLMKGRPYTGMSLFTFLLPIRA